MNNTCTVGVRVMEILRQSALDSNRNVLLDSGMVMMISGGWATGEYEFRDLLDEMIQQRLVILIHFDNGLVCRGHLAVRKVEEIEIDGLFGEGFVLHLEVILLYPALCGEGRGIRGHWRWLECTEG